MGMCVSQLQQGPHCTGKMAENPTHGKHKEVGQFAKTQGKYRVFCVLML